MKVIDYFQNRSGSMVLTDLVDMAGWCLFNFAFGTLISIGFVLTKFGAGFNLAANKLKKLKNGSDRVGKYPGFIPGTSSASTSGFRDKESSPTEIKDSETSEEHPEDSGKS